MSTEIIFMLIIHLVKKYCAMYEIQYVKIQSRKETMQENFLLITPRNYSAINVLLNNDYTCLLMCLILF